MTMQGRGHMSVVKRMILALVYVLTVPVSATSAPRLFVNEDAWVFFGRHHDRSVTDRAGLVGEIEAYIDTFAEHGRVTDIAFNVNGMRAGYPSAVNETMWATEKPDGTMAFAGSVQKRYYDLGLDPYALALSRCRERGMKGWISMRMNDVHFITASNNLWQGSAMWRRHPEWRQVKDEEPAGSARDWNDFAWDYGVKELRDFQFSIFKEIADRYDADGYELDFVRWWRPLAPGRERVDAPCVTEFIRRCRAYTRELATKRSHSVLLSVRVPAVLARAHELGFDVEVWAKEDVVDLLVPCNFFSPIDFDLDFAEWTRAIGAANPKTGLLPGATDCFAQEPCRVQWEAWNAWADRRYREGATGLYLYNFSYLDKPTLERLKREGLPPDRVGAAPRRYVVTHHDICEPKAQARQLPVYLTEDAMISIHVSSPPARGETAEVVVAIQKDDAPAPQIWFNGVKASGAPFRGEKPRTYGNDKTSRTVWHYPVTPLSVRRGINRIKVGSIGEKVFLRWVELAVH